MKSIEQSLTLVIPTLWRAKAFPMNILSAADSSVISEIIIIDNNPADAPEFEHSKISIISKGGNIYVNPAWNWGVSKSSSRFTCLLNDDIEATVKLFEYAASILDEDSNNEIGIIGLDWSQKNEILGHHDVTEREIGFGEAMFFRTKDFTRIPNPLKIWCGDDYLFFHQQMRGKRIVAISGVVRTESSPSSSQTINSDRQGFNPILKRDEKLWHGFYKKLLLLKYHPFATIRKSISYRIRNY